MTRSSDDARSHVVVLTQFYSPEPSIYNAPIADALLKQGHRVSVVTGYPNRPEGKLYPTYRQKFRYSEEIAGVTVHRVPLVISYSNKSLGRILNFLSFSVSALTVSSAIRDADAIYVYATPATAAIPAQLWKRWYGIPYVLHVQDLWPESVTGSGMMGRGMITRIAESAMKPWLQRLYRGAESLIAISPGMRDLLAKRGDGTDSCAVVYNWADESTVTSKDSESFSKEGVRLLYAGNLGPMQDLDTVLSAAASVDDEPGFQLTIAGGGILEEALKARSTGLTKTRLLGRLSRSEVGRLYKQSDFQLVTLKDLPIFRTTVPSKLQASLASGTPVITTVKGDVADLIRKHDAGIVADPEDPLSLAAAFRQALHLPLEDRVRMGGNARALYEKVMSKQTGLAAIMAVIENTIRSKGSQSDAIAGEHLLHENLR